MDDTPAELKASAHFNTACAHGNQGQAGLAVQALHKWAEHDGQSTQRKLDADTDFDAIREDAAFVKFRDTLPTGEQEA